MILTGNILYELVKQKLDITVPPEELDNMDIRHILPWTGTNQSDSILYIAINQEHPNIWNSLSIGPESREEGWHIVSGDPMSAFSILLQSVQSYQHWMERCTYLAEAEHETGALLKQISSGSDLSLAVFDREYGNPYSSGSWEEPFGVSMPVQEMEKLYQDDPAFDQTFQEKGLVYYAKTEDGLLYYKNIFQENFYIGRIVILFAAEEAGKGMLQMADELCRLVEASYQYEYRHSGDKGTGKEVYECCRKFLQNEPFDRKVLEKMLSDRGWERHQKYQILCLRSNGYFQSEQTIKYYAMLFEQLIPETIALQIDSTMYCIHNPGQENAELFHQKMVSFLRENLFVAGISCMYDDFFDGYRYKLQAEDALLYGQKADPSIWKYEFSEYVSEYCLAQCMRSYPAIDLCPANLRKIVEYNDRHPENELLETLRQYYRSQFNAQLTSERLFIHRTTFFYRLRKIQNIAPFHPEDPVETRQFLLAFEAMTE